VEIIKGLLILASQEIAQVEIGFALSFLETPKGYPKSSGILQNSTVTPWEVNRLQNSW